MLLSLSPTINIESNLFETFLHSPSCRPHISMFHFGRGQRQQLEDDGRRHLRGRHSCRAPVFTRAALLAHAPSCENHQTEKPNNDTGNRFVSHSPHYRLVQLDPILNKS